MTSQPFSVPAWLILAAALPLILGLVPRNGVYGVRTRRTLSDDNVWLRSNRFAGVAFSVSSLIYLTFAKMHPTSGPHDPNFSLWLMHLGAFLLPLVASVMLTLMYARRL